MTEFGRPLGTDATGQREASPRRFNTGVASNDMLRSRDQSGNRTFLKHLESLQELIDDVGDPVWACGPTAAALYPYDEFVLQPPFSLLVPRGRFVNRIGHVIHTTTVLDPIDREETMGIPITAPARTVIDLARHEPSLRLTLAIDSGLRDLRFTYIRVSPHSGRVVGSESRNCSGRSKEPRSPEAGTAGSSGGSSNSATATRCQRQRLRSC